MESHNEFTTAPSSQEADEWIEAFLKEPSRPSRFWVRSKPWNRFIVSRISECYSEYSVAARVVILFLLYSIHHGPDELRIEPEKTEDGGTKLRIADVRQGESVELVPPPSIIFDGIVKELKALAGLAGHRLAERLRAVGRWIDGQPMHTSVGRFEIVAGDEIMRVDLHIIPSAAGDRLTLKFFEASAHTSALGKKETMEIFKDCHFAENEEEAQSNPEDDHSQHNGPEQAEP